MAIKLYHYHLLHGDFLYSSEAAIDPLESSENNPVALVPSYATLIKPPAARKGNVPVFDATAQTWSLVEDHRGQLFDTATGEVVEHRELGPVPTGITNSAPAEHESWNGKAWAFDSAKAIAARRMAIDLSYQAAIDAIIAPYPASERETWSIQEAEALAFSTDNAVTTPFLSALASARSVSVADLAPSIISKATQFKAASGTAIGQRRSLLDALDRLAAKQFTKLTDIDSVIWS